MRSARYPIATGVRAEAVRTGGRRSTVWLVGIPLAVISGLLITIAVAVVAERFAAIGAAADPTAIRVTSVATTNAVYWIITLTVTVGAVVATAAQASAMREPIADLERFSFPTVATMPIARWLYYGAITATASGLLVTGALLLLPRAFPLVYGGVELTSDAGLRFIWAVPAYGFGACGFGVGIAALIGNSAGAIGVLLGWMYVVETAISLAPHGYAMQAYMPFLNGVYSTGQELAFSAPWSGNGALVYFLALAVVVFGIGLARESRRRA